MGGPLRLLGRGSNRPAGAAGPLGRTEALALIGIIGLAAGLRLYQLGSRSVWLDEASSLWAARLPWPQLIPTLATHDETPPLYYALLHLWIAFGDGEAWIVPRDLGVARSDDSPAREPDL